MAKIGVPASILGRTGGVDLVLAPDKQIAVSRLRTAHESWFPGYMAAGAR